MARINFKDEPDGSVSYELEIEEGDSVLSPAVMAAMALAKRGLTKEEMEIYKLQGSFGWKVP